MKHLFNSILTLLAVVLLAACSSEKDGTECLKLIPEDAAIVIRCDLKATGEGLGCNKDEASIKKLKKMMEKAIDDDEILEKVEAIIDNPAESGIDPSNPIYLYVAPNLDNLVGLVGTTSDKDKFVEILNMLSDEADLDGVEEKDDMSFMAIQKVAIVVADDWFYIGMGGEDAEGRAEDLKELTEADEAPIMKNEDFKALMEKKGMMQMLISGRGLDAFVGKASMFGGSTRDIKQVLSMLPGKLADISILMNSDLSNGVGTGTIETLAYSAEWKDAIKEFDGLFGNISSDLNKYMSKDGISLLANIDGNKALELFDKVSNKLGNQMDDEQLAILRQVLTSVAGNMAYTFKIYRNDVVGSCYIATKDASIVQLIAQNADAEDLMKTDDNNFKMYSYNYDYDYDTNEMVKTDITGITFFGYQNGLTYFLFTKDQNDMPFKTADKPLPGSQVKGKGIYAYMDYAAIADAMKSEYPDEAQVALDKMASIIDYTEMYYEGNGKFVGRSVMKDKNVSLFKVYIDLFESLMK